MVSDKRGVASVSNCWSLVFEVLIGQDLCLIKVIYQGVMSSGRISVTIFLFQFYNFSTFKVQTLLKGSQVDPITFTFSENSNYEREILLEV